MLAASSAGAQEPTVLDLEVFRSDEGLLCRVGLTDLLSAYRVDRMHDGLQLDLECRSELRRPRRWWGTSIVTDTTTTLRLGYDLTDARYYIKELPDELARVASFSSLAQLHRFLADSVLISIAPDPPLRQNRHYRLHMYVAASWYTDFSVTKTAEEASKSFSPVRYLFDSFLDLAGYGRESISAQTPSFRLADLPER